VVQPHRQTDRHAPLDILRGLALSGVLMVNLLTLFRVSLFAHIAGSDDAGGAAGRVISALVAVLVEFKAFTLFSFLFGVGVAVQAERASGRGSAALFLTRRFLVLLAIGLIHLLFIWNGDILTLYAVCGFLLIPMTGLRTSMMAMAGVVLVIVGYLGVLPVEFPGGAELRQQSAAATRVYGRGGYAEIVAFSWRETRTFIVPLLVLTLPKTLGVMLLGMAAWRWELLTKRRKAWMPILAVSAAVGIAGTILQSNLAAHVPLAFAYAAAVLLWLPGGPLLAAGGQMALTNYLMQSVVFCLVFYGYGLGQFGRLDVWPVAAGGVVFYLAQLVFSRAWLRRFHFGPVEWLWRSLTYGRRQPMLRGGEFVVSRSCVRVLVVLVLLVGAPLIHGGIAALLGGRGPHWGWTGDVPGAVNRAGVLLVASALALLVWILATDLRTIPLLPERVALGLRPALLIQEGPYGRMRHPMYVAEGLLWLGFGMFFGSVLVMAVFAAVAIIVGMVIIPREERALEAYFGDEYRAYRRRVPALPGFWAGRGGR
jgi:uncharacterized protein